MKKRILAVLETEQEYADLFLRFLKEKKDGLFESRIFTKEEALQAYLKEERADVLLASEESNYEQFQEQIPFVILLTENCYVKEGEDTPTIYKFQSAEQILKDVLKLYVEQNEDGQVRYLSKDRRFCRKIAVFSPYGGCGKTTTAAILGSLLGREQKVLMVSLEAYKKPCCWLDGPENGGLSELLYYIQQERGNLEMKLKSMVIRIGNMDYLSGVSNVFDLQKMCAEEMYACIHAIEQYSEYDVVIFDISFVSEALLPLFEECEVIYQPVQKRQDNYKKQDNSTWQESFSKKEQKLLKEKCKKLILPWEQGGLDGNIEYLTASAVGEAISSYCFPEEKFAVNHNSLATDS